MRVAFVDQTGDAAGGAERSLAILLGALPGDIEPHALLFSDGAYAASLRARGIAVTIASLPSSFMNTTRENPLAGIAAVPVAVAAIAGYLRSIRPDIVYTNTVKAHAVALPAARLLRLPSIAHLRDILTGAGRIALRATIGACSRRRIAVSRAVGASFALHATDVIACPLVLEDYLALPSRSAARDALGIPRQAVLLSLVGRINRWKGHDRFVRVAGRLRAYANLHIAIVGAPLFRDADFVAELHALAAAEGLTGRVHFVPWLDDVRTAYAASDINVNCSENEPFGRTIIEAAACGVPTVAFSGGGTADALIDGETGILVPPNDEARFARALQTYLDDPTALHAAGARARAFAGSFDAPRHAARVAAVLRSVSAT
jgi:hypothetical protein